MDRRRFIRRACAATVVTTTGIAGCPSDGGGGGDGGGGDGSDGGSGDGSDGGNGGDGSDGGSGDGGDGSSGDGGDGMGSGTTAGGSMGGSRAPYDTWASPSVYGSDTVQAFTADAQRLRELSGTATPTPTPQGTQRPTDPAIGISATFLLAAAFSGLSLTGTGLSEMTSRDSLESIHGVGDGIVYEGSFDAESLASAVGQSQALSEAGTYNGYTLYTPGSGDGGSGTSTPGFGMSASPLALSGNAVVTVGSDASDPRSAIEAIIDAGAGNAPAYGSEHGAYEELVTALETRAVMGVGFSPNEPLNAGTATPTPQGPSVTGGFASMSDLNLEGDVRGYATSLDFSQEEATVGMAIRYTSPGEVDDAEMIRSRAVPNAQDASVSTNGSLVMLQATYAGFSATG